MRDLREISADVLGILGGMLSWYPPRSPGRRALRECLEKIRTEYILGRPHKLKMIVNEINAGNSAFTDILECTGIARAELEELLQELVEDGYVRETQKRPWSTNGAGRPVRTFDLNYEIGRNNSPK